MKTEKKISQKSAFVIMKATSQNVGLFIGGKMVIGLRNIKALTVTIQLRIEKRQQEILLPNGKKS